MAAPEEKDTEKPEGQAQAPKKSKKGLFIIIGGVVLVIIIGVVAALMLGGGGKKEGTAEEVHEEGKEATHYQTARLDTFIVNLSESTAFIKVTMLLEYDPAVLAKVTGGKGEGGGHASGGGAKSAEGPVTGGMPPIMRDREPMMKDAIIRVLSSKTVQEVLTVEGKEKLKEELIEAVNEAIGLEESPVVNIYFVEFIIQ